MQAHTCTPLNPFVFVKLQNFYVQLSTFMIKWILSQRGLAVYSARTLQSFIAVCVKNGDKPAVSARRFIFNSQVCQTFTYSLLLLPPLPSSHIPVLTLNNSPSGRERRGWGAKNLQFKQHFDMIVGWSKPWCQVRHQREKSKCGNAGVVILESESGRKRNALIKMAQTRTTALQQSPDNPVVECWWGLLCAAPSRFPCVARLFFISQTIASRLACTKRPSPVCADYFLKEVPLLNYTTCWLWWGFFLPIVRVFIFCAWAYVFFFCLHPRRQWNINLSWSQTVRSSSTAEIGARLLPSWWTKPPSRHCNDDIYTRVVVSNINQCCEKTMHGFVCFFEVVMLINTFSCDGMSRVLAFKCSLKLEFPFKKKIKKSKTFCLQPKERCVILKSERQWVLGTEKTFEGVWQENELFSVSLCIATVWHWGTNAADLLSLDK